MKDKVKEVLENFPASWMQFVKPLGMKLDAEDGSSRMAQSFNLIVLSRRKFY
jgi:hypothetical protein